MTQPPLPADHPPRRHLIALALLAFALRAWPIDRGLPFAEAYTSDTERFVAVAAQMAEEGDANPHWFGHPAATFIGPLAMSFWAVDRWTPNPAPFADDPTPFYVMGRLLSALYGMLAILLTYDLGRYLASQRAGLVAGWLLAVSPTHVYFSQIARADTAAVVFTTAALIGCLRIVRRPARRWYALAGTAAGLATASKYIAGPVALAIPLAHWLRTPPSTSTTSWLSSSRSWGSRSRLSTSTPAADRGTDNAPRAGRRRDLALALVLAPLAFVVASPFNVLDAPSALRDLTVEMRTTHLGADGLSPLGNAAWYIGHALPLGLGTLSIVVAVFGALHLLRRDRRAGSVLVFHAAAYTALASLSPLHWSHWLLPIFPAVATFAGVGADRAALIIEGLGRWPAARGLATALVAGMLGWPSAATVLRSLAAHGRPDTRIVAKTWLEHNLPERTRLVREAYTAPIASDRFDVRTVFSLSRCQLRQYIEDGTAYVMTSSAVGSRFSAEPERYQQELRFYDGLARCGQLVYEVGPVAGERLGPTIRVYRLPPTARADVECRAP